MFNTQFSGIVLTFVFVGVLNLAVCVGQSARAEQVIFRLETTDMSGQQISEINLGQDFMLQAFTQDIRDEPLGVFSAYLDVIYDRDLVASMPQIDYGDDYPNGRTGLPDVFMTDGVMDEIGAFAGLDPFDVIDRFGGGERLLFKVPMHAMSIGTATFTAESADLLPLHEVLLFDSDDGPVPVEQILFQGSNLRIVPEPRDLLSIPLALFALIALNGRRRTV